MWHLFFVVLFRVLVVRFSQVELGVVVAQQQVTVNQTTATLSEARYALAATSSGELVFFGGGYNATGPSDRVDIYNVTNGGWTTATLSIPRNDLAAASSGNLVLFAGGCCYFAQVDIYNTTDGSWTTATLSQNRSSLAATSVGSLVLFGGGWIGSASNFDVVDIYNVTSNIWTNATLSQARSALAATSVANRYAIFAGGWTGTVASNVVDIFDSLIGEWNTTTLSKNQQYLAATSLNNLAFFGGGQDATFQPSNVVDIFNSTTQTWSTATLSQSRYDLAAASIGDIVAFGGGWNNSAYFLVVDMYNVASNIWFTATLSQARNGLAATSSINKILFSGGLPSDSIDSNAVDIFEIFSYSTPPEVSTLPMSPSIPLSGTQLLSTTPLTSPSMMNKTNVTLTSQKSTSNTLLIGAVLGAIFGSIFMVMTIILIVFVTRKQRKSKKKNGEVWKGKEPTNESGSVTVEERRETVMMDSTQNDSNIISDATTNPATISTFQLETETLKGLISGQIPLNELEISSEIGEGTYGRVCVGKWKKYRVALKFCQNRGKMDEFLREANLMISLPPHPNVVGMYGVSIDGTQPIIVMEYCAGGSLDKLLFDEKRPISKEQKIMWVHELAIGMRHLHKHNIVHRDLAARNILLSHPNPNDAQLKISDFGMSRVLQEDIESKTRNTVGPIRWMAPESIRDQIYSKKSDVWMFGVLIYEIVAQREPHVGVDPKNVLILIRDKGLTPEIPSNCPEKLRQLMEMCWKKQPDQRPTMETICAFLEKE